MERNELNELLSMYYQIRELIRKYSHVDQFITVTDTIEKEYSRLCDIQADAEQTRRLNWLRDKMDCNNEGACFHYDAFKNKTDDVCYIPANAESMDDVFTYQQLRFEVIRWLKQESTINWLVGNGEEIEYKTNPVNLMTYPVISPYVDQYLNVLFSGLTWEFPSTYLNELLND